MTLQTARPMFTSARNTGEGWRDEYETPRELFQQLDALFRFDLDVCASAQNALCPRFYTEADDGLRQRWAPWVSWCNPPYSSAGAWVRKAWHEAQRGAVVVVLVPPRTDAAWWHEWAMRADRLVLLEGRVQFTLGGKRPLDGKGKPSSNQHPSSLLVFDPFGQFAQVEIGRPGPRVSGWDWKAAPEPDVRP